ncbi:hypothetical protein Ade02nite_19040 [Paractinoplanes deccanensis]|uniref:Uncharacterized protein n=1 Tax=Paractinoplanes deccanensis TaxID=113561 RepID=A0ABQ3XZV2_9ACTN|nr:hypothetical protein [Actinoplanes deccanensis]GID73263.1 hypothetical protein Ade02nite_19040 [Actinoplanes deccanensis]
MTYAVIMQYPGDGELEANRAEFFGTLDEAVAWRDRQGEDWLKVFRVEPVTESAMWDWSIRKAGTDEQPNFAYTSEQAARSSCSGGMELVRRRRGSSVWVAA